MLRKLLERIKTFQLRTVIGFSPFEVEIAVAKLKEYRLSGTDEIPAELIQAGGESSVR
jgi:hypothetical protein